MEEMEKKVEETGTEEKIEAMKLDQVVEPESKGQKIVKWVLRGLAIVASGIGGFILGRATGKDDDDSEGTEETTEG